MQNGRVRREWVIPKHSSSTSSENCQKVDLFEEVKLCRQSVVSREGNFKEQKKGIKEQLVARGLQVQDSSYFRTD